MTQALFLSPCTSGNLEVAPLGQVLQKGQKSMAVPLWWLVLQSRSQRAMGMTETPQQPCAGAAPSWEGQALPMREHRKHLCPCCVASGRDRQGSLHKPFPAVSWAYSQSQEAVRLLALYSGAIVRGEPPLTIWEAL